MNSLPTSNILVKGLSVLLLLACFVLGVSTVQAQALTIGSVQACTASEVVVPVMGDGINNVGSITLFITFNSPDISFVSVDNIDGQIQNMNYSLNQNPLKLAFAWSGVNPVSFQQKKLFDLRFSFSGNSSDIVFTNECEIATNALQILPINYTNGKLISGLPKINTQPKDTLIKPGASATFAVDASNVETYSWKESTDNGLTWNNLVDGDNYFGTYSNELTIKTIPVSYNNNKYNCNISSKQCMVKTVDAVLTVDNQSSIGESTKSENINLTAKPNPVNISTVFSFSLSDNGEIEIMILDLSGKVIQIIETAYYIKGEHTIEFDASLLTKGIYVVKLVENNKKGGNVACIKLVKT